MTSPARGKRERQARLEADRERRAKLREPASPAPTPVGAHGWLAEDKAAAEKLLTNARSVREELAQPSMLGKLAPGWGFWPGVERAAIRWAASVAALEAVLARHKPWDHHDYPHEGATCEECGDWYPCNTVRDLESALRDAQGAAT